MSSCVCVCGAAVKYRCPACGVRSCSAPCVARHKADANCTGKRPVAPYKPLLELGDDDLASDYHFLEDLLRVVGAAGRGTATVTARAAGGHRPPGRSSTCYAIGCARTFECRFIRSE